MLTNTLLEVFQNEKSTFPSINAFHGRQVNWAEQSYFSN